MQSQDHTYTCDGDGCGWSGNETSIEHQRKPGRPSLEGNKRSYRTTKPNSEYSTFRVCPECGKYLGHIQPPEMDIESLKIIFSFYGKFFIGFLLFMYVIGIFP